MNLTLKPVTLKPLMLAGLLATTLTTPLVALAGEVSVTGEGLVTFAPDSARLQFTATAEAADPAAATDQVADIMAAWREATEDLMPQLGDYSDADVNLYTRTLPVDERGDTPVQRSVATQTIRFTVSDLELLNPILALAQQLGLQYQLDAQQFFHSREQAFELDALGLAVDNALARCDFVAKRLGQKCGEVISISVNSGHSPMPMMMAEAKASRDVISSVGPTEIRASVNATFALE